MKLILSLLAGLCVVCANAYTATAEELAGKEIKKLISNKTVYLATGYGFEFPLVYRGNGRVTGDGTGTGLEKYFAPKETGKWWVKGDRMCQKFPTWYDGKTLCFTLKQTGSKSLIWKSHDGKRGKARIG